MDDHDNGYGALRRTGTMERLLWTAAQRMPRARTALWVVIAAGLALALPDGLPRAAHDAGCVALLCALGALWFAGRWA